MKARGHAWSLARGLFGVCLVFYALTIAFAAGYRFPPWDAPFIVGFVITPAVGAMVASQQPRNPVGSLLLATGLGFGIAGLGEYAALSEARSLPLGRYVGWLAQTDYFGIVICGAVLVPLYFPNGRLLTPRWRIALPLAAAALLFSTVGYSLRPGKLDSAYVDSQNPFGVGGTQWLLAVGFILLVGAIIAAGLSLILRFVRSYGEERQQLKWIAFVAVLLALTFGVSGVMEDENAQMSFAIELAFYTLLFFGLPAAIGIGILRYCLWDIDLVIQRSFVYGTLWLAISGAYFGAALALGLAASSRVPVWLAVTITVLATLLFQPARPWLEIIADRCVFGRRMQPVKVMHDFGERLGGSADPGDIADQLARAAVTAVSLAWVQVTTDGSPQAGLGRPSDQPLVQLSLVYGDERLGEMACQPVAGSRLTEEDRSTLAALAAQAAVAISRARLAARIVRAQAAERRRIERNIHDGAQQELVALVAKIGLARRQNGHLNHASLLLELQDEVSLILGNLRELAQGVHPSVLTDGGSRHCGRGSLLPPAHPDCARHLDSASLPSARRGC